MLVLDCDFRHPVPLARELATIDVIAEGRWISGRKRVHVADARLIDPDREEAARGTGTFMRSRIPLASLAGYADSASA